MKVFISSTSEDLRPYRQAAADVIQDAQWVPVGMEHFPADPRPIVRLCREEVGQCGLVILLQAFRSGWVPEPEKGGDGKTSITGLEIAAADELAIPVLAFLANEDWPGRLWDHDPAALAWTRDFRNGLNRSAKFFPWEQDPKLPLFRALLSQELANYRMRGLAEPDSRTMAPSATLRAPSAESPLPAEPYPLLGPYEHPRTFAGRDAEVAKLAILVRLPPLVLCVHAPSGAGKSSLLLAGLGPRLRSLGYAVSIERSPGDSGLAQRLLRDLFEPPDGIVIGDDDADLPAAFARWIAHAHTLSGKPAVLILDQIDDVLRSPANRDPALAWIGPLLAATAQRLPGLQGFACKWVLCYRHEFHGEVRGWLEDVLAQARALDLPGLRSLPHDLSDPQKSHDWVLPVMGKPAPGGDGEEQSERAFLEAITAPLALLEEGRPVYHRYRLPADGAQRLAAAFAHARQRQPDAPLVPELQVVLNHLLQRADDSGTAHDGVVTVEVPPDEELETEIKHALAHHLERVLSNAFPEGRDPAADRLARTRALLGLHQLADAEGRRGEGLPEEELVRLLGPDGKEVLDCLSSPQARLLVMAGGRYSLSHDRLAEVVSELVQSEAARGNLLLDQRLIDLQRIIGQKAALFQADPADESALALTRPQIELIERSCDTLLFDASRQSWHQASQRRRRLKRRRLLRAVAILLAGIGLLVLTIWKPPKVGVTWEAYPTEPRDWTVRGDLAISTIVDRGVTVWNLRKPFPSHITSKVLCDRYEISITGRYIVGMTAKGDLYVWNTSGLMEFTPQPLLSGIESPPLSLFTPVGFSSDDRFIFATTPRGDIYLWNPAHPGDARIPFARIVTKPEKGDSMPDFPNTSFSPRGSWLIVATRNKVFGFRTAAERGRLAEPALTLVSEDALRFSADEQWLLWQDLSKPVSRLYLKKLSTNTTIDLGEPRYNGRVSGFNSRFSPGARWLVGRRVSRAFIAWDLQASAPEAGVPAAGSATPGRDAAFWLSPIWFSSKEDWAAGLANDACLHLWSLRKPPGWDDKPLFPEEYEYGGFNQLVFAFSPDGTRAAATAPNGGLYVWRLGETIDRDRPVGHPGPGARVRFSDDSKFLYAADSKNLYFGPVGNSLDIALSPKSLVQVIAVIPGHRFLAVFTKNEVLLGMRRLSVWGIPLPFDLSWPALSRPLELKPKVPLTPPD
jgi:WD40 repeat protein